jgi:C-terminal processing protease CtpA/Prc
MFENAVKGYVDAIGDPYTVYLTRDENEIFDEEMQGSQNFE